MRQSFLVIGNPSTLRAPDSHLHFTHFKGYLESAKHSFAAADFLGRAEPSLEEFSAAELLANELYAYSISKLRDFYEREEGLPSLSEEQLQIGLGHILLRACRKFSYLSGLPKALEEHGAKKVSLHFDDKTIQFPVCSRESFSTLQTEQFDALIIRHLFSDIFVQPEPLPQRIRIGAPKFASRAYEPYRLLARSFGGKRISVKGTYLTKFEEARLEMSYTQPPRLRFLEGEDVIISAGEMQSDRDLRFRLREDLLKSFQGNSAESASFSWMVSAIIPFLYLGGARRLRDWSKKYSSKQTSLYLTANSYMADDIYKAIVMFRRAGASHAVMQHGNLVGTHTHFTNTIEERTADTYLTWGWKGMRNGRDVIPVGVQKDLRKWRKKNSKAETYLLITKGSSPNWWCWDAGAEHYRYLEYVSDFVRSLDEASKQRLVIRTYSDKGALPRDDQTIISELGEYSSGFSNFEQPLADLLRNARLIIHGYDSTGIAESLVTDRPFIALLPSFPGLLQPKYIDVYEKLIQSKLFFIDTRSAAMHLRTIEGQEQDWWRSSEVSAARELMMSSFAHPIKGPKVSTLRKSLSAHL